MKIRFFLYFIISFLTWLIVMGLCFMLSIEVILPLLNISENYIYYDEIILSILGIDILLSGLAFAYYFTSPLYFLKSWIDNLSKNDFTIPHNSIKIYDKKLKLHKNYRLYNEVIENLFILSENLQKNKKEKAKLEQLKRDWIAGISHDLKTPLTSITGYSVLLLDENMSYTHEEEMSFLKEISDKSIQINDLINDLNLSIKIDDCGIQLDLSQYNLVDFLKELIINITNNPITYDYNFTFEPESPEILMTFDKKFMSRALQNLIMNCILHNPAGTDITIKISTFNNDSINIIISDNGVGMDKQTVDNIFNKYYQGNLQKNKCGSGLGMSIAKGLILALGGDITLESELSAGTTFFVKFPLN